MRRRPYRPRIRFERNVRPIGKADQAPSIMGWGMDPDGLGKRSGLRLTGNETFGMSGNGSRSTAFLLAMI